MSGSVYFEGNAFIDGGRVQNSNIISTSISNCNIGTSTLDMNLQNITSVKDPVNPQDAATKKYVDDLGIVISTITLIGENDTEISTNKVGSFIIKVTNKATIPSGGPSAVFNVSKTIQASHSHVARITASPGMGSNIGLMISWPPNSGILLKKTGNSFDGTYEAKLM